MEDYVQQVGEYLPIRTSEPRLQKLLEHHFLSLRSCIQNNLFSSSLLHLHILYMIFVYLQLQRIANYDERAFKLSLIGFSQNEKNLLKEPKYPLAFSVINEKSVFRLFRLNDIDDQIIDELSKPVKRRNNHSHASQDIECENEQEFEKIVTEYIRNMDKLLEKNTNILDALYSDPSVQILNDEDYEITYDDLENSLLAPNYFSAKELALVCAGKKDRLTLRLSEDYGFEI